jgi:hypothetical protein
VIDLVHLDSPVNGPCKHETGKESNRSTKESKADGNHAHVGQVDDDGQETNQIQSARQEPDTVQEQVDTGHCIIPKGLPPPTMIFGTKLQITQDDGNLSARGGQDTNDGQQESHDVVDLMQPQGGHDECQFNADGSKGQDSSHAHGQEGIHVPGSFRNDASDLVAPGRDFND